MHLLFYTGSRNLYAFILKILQIWWLLKYLFVAFLGSTKRQVKPKVEGHLNLGQKQDNILIATRFCEQLEQSGKPSLLGASLFMSGCKEEFKLWIHDERFADGKICFKW